jgi:hypothetical protein
MKGPILEKNHMLANIVTKSSPNLTLQRNMRGPILKEKKSLIQALIKTINRILQLVKFKWVRQSINAKFVQTFLTIAHLYWGTKGPILEKNHMLANIVTKSLPNLTLQRYMSGSILEKNHILANIVTIGLPYPKVQSIMKVFTPGKNHTPVMIVEAASQKIVLYFITKSDVRRATKNHPKYLKMRNFLQPMLSFKTCNVLPVNKNQ